MVEVSRAGVLFFGSARRSAAIVLGLVAVSVSTPSAAASTARPGPRSPGSRGRNAKATARISSSSAPRLRCRWTGTTPNGKQIELAVIRHLASDPRSGSGRCSSTRADRARAARLGGELGRRLRRWGGGRFDVVGWDPRGTNRSSPVECFTSTGGRGPVLGRGVHSRHPGRVGGLPAQDRRAGAPLRRGERGAPVAHLHRRHRPRPRRAAQRSSGTASSPTSACPTDR